MSVSLNGNGNFEDGKTHLAQSDEGMVASAHPLATGAGLRVLKSGGNAVDAAVAAAATLNVVEPGSTGVGGDVFALVRMASDGKINCLNASGRSPAAASAEELLAKGIESISGDDSSMIEDSLRKHSKISCPGDVYYNNIDDRGC